jgi:hypothetical protein
MGLMTGGATLRFGGFMLESTGAGLVSVTFETELIAGGTAAQFPALVDWRVAHECKLAGPEMGFRDRPHKWQRLNRTLGQSSKVDRDSFEDFPCAEQTQ